MVKAKAPFKRGTILVYTGPDAPEQDVKYVSWFGFSRSSLITVKLQNGREITAHVNDVRPKNVQ